MFAWMAVAMLLTQACALQTGSPVQPDLVAQPAIVTIARGTFSDISQAQETFVRERSQWEAFWRSHAPSQPLPAVDFATHAVAAVFLGTRPTGGFAVEITGTRRDGDTLVIEYVERSPGPDDIVTQVVTSPFHIIRLLRQDGSARFEKPPVAGGRRGGRG